VHIAINFKQNRNPFQEDMGIKILIADDHAIIREGLKSLLEKKGITGIEVAKNGREAIDLAIAHHPDVIIMDISMPNLNGMDATATIRKEVPNTKIIALSMHSSKQSIDKMFASGASGYILKESAVDELYQAIQEVNAGNYYLTPSIGRMYLNGRGPLFNDMDDLPKSKKISKKEREVLQLVAEGQKNRDIAEKLSVSIKTIESHRRNIMKKLNIFTIAGLTKFAIKEGMVSLE
jgi:DNA-binding NarL/FixJ family response regulator